MLTHREFSAWITSEGEQLREYLVAVDENANRVSCWIPSEAGKSFSVHWRDEGTNVHTCSFISLDGFVVPGRFLFGMGEASREGIRTGPMTERPFMFAQHENAVAAGEQCNRDVGTIVLKIKRVVVVGQKVANKLQQVPDLSESQSSQFSHRIDYGEERPTQEQFPSTWQVKPYDETGKRSYVTFVFRYRSREFLTSQGIMTEDDGTAKPASLVSKNIRQAKRRVASAPLPTPEGSAESLITPSPTPSPNNSKKKFDRLSSSMKSAFNPALGRNRPQGNVRTVSMKAPGRYDRYPGEGTLQLYPPPDPSRFRTSPETEDGSQKTEGEGTRTSQDAVAV